MGWNWLTGIFGGDDEEPQLPAPPAYQEDPNYRTTQDFLQKYGMNLMEGNPNSYYGEVGNFGGPEFEKMLSLSNRDIQQSAAEAAASSGRGRGGFLPSITAQSVADNSSRLRFQDYLKAMQGRQWLFGEGRGITEGVRNTGQAEGLYRNNFNMKGYDYQRENELFNIGRKDQAAGARGDMIGNLFQMGVGAVAGGVTGGVPGAVLGALGGTDVLAQSGAFDNLFGQGQKSTGVSPGVSELGSIKASGSELEDIFASLFRKG